MDDSASCLVIPSPSHLLNQTLRNQEPLEFPPCFLSQCPLPRAQKCEERCNIPIHKILSPSVLTRVTDAEKGSVFQVPQRRDQTQTHPSDFF
ncbi:hypothetical protein GOP47_0022579 [Adiantum capillus-veneris]|uniref:Uncharacterized protein n=1 Tax=Adiantum capillus-veneris TaxID=13818 RepID=A0A9D4U6J7_ADICA|nr:hypothetical protein GOP47_0022579 [Adiantum capillus-veneris]